MTETPKEYRAAEAMMAVIDNKPEKPLEKSVPDRPTTKYNVETIATDILEVTPTALLNRLLASEGNMKRAFWDIGDDTNSLWEIVMANKKPYTKIQVCAAVGKITDRSFNSVWQYAQTSLFYPQEVREEFDALPYSHFDLARQFHGVDEDGVPTWRRVLEESLDYMAQYGTPPARNTLASRVFRLREISLDTLNNGGDPAKPLVPDFVSQVLQSATIEGLMPHEIDGDEQMDSKKVRSDLDTLYREVRLLVVELSSRLQSLSILEGQMGRHILTGALSKVIVQVKAFLEAAEVFNGNTKQRKSSVYGYDNIDTERD